MLFFECLTALLDPVHRRGERIKWGLVSYTVVMFSLATVNIAMNPHIQLISYVDNRDIRFGPYGYSSSTLFNAVVVVPQAAFRLANWLGDGLLVSPLFGTAFTRPRAQRRPL